MKNDVTDQESPPKVWRFAMELGKTCGCHQLPERSFFLGRYQFPFCARCTGVLAGEIFAIALFLAGFRPWWGILLTLPLIVDGSLQYFGLVASTNARRLVTGLLAGTGFALFLFQGIHWLFTTLLW